MQNKIYSCMMKNFLLLAKQHTYEGKLLQGNLIARNDDV